MSKNEAPTKKKLYCVTTENDSPEPKGLCSDTINVVDDVFCWLLHARWIQEVALTTESTLNLAPHLSKSEDPYPRSWLGVNCILSKPKKITLNVIRNLAADGQDIRPELRVIPALDAADNGWGDIFAFFVERYGPFDKEDQEFIRKDIFRSAVFDGHPEVVRQIMQMDVGQDITYRECENALRMVKKHSSMGVSAEELSRHIEVMSILAQRIGYSPNWVKSAKRKMQKENKNVLRRRHK